MSNALEYFVDKEIRVDAGFGFQNVHIRLAIPNMPRVARLASFSEHLIDHVSGDATRNIISIFKGGVAISNDLGESWEAMALGDAIDADFVHSFTTHNGHHLLQTRAPPRDSDFELKERDSLIYRFDRDWIYTGACRPGQSHWHGSCSIDQYANTIIYAEYPNNKAKYERNRTGSGDLLDLRMAAVFRSRDDGASWEKVFEQDWNDIRHFHTVVADRFVPGQWWLSSGDLPDESRVWLSKDDGDSWFDVSAERPDIALHVSMRGKERAAFRYTDIWLGREYLVWGSDDWLGGSSRAIDQTPSAERVGSRIFRARRSECLKPEILGYVGNPIRSIIDVGPALVALTEAKHAVIANPQVVLISKTDPMVVTELMQIENPSSISTGFSFSRASRKAMDGVFFSHRSRHDVADRPTRILRWELEFS
jgi:hypothetical protein